MICNICKQKVYSSEAYCKLIEFNEKHKERSVGYYHVTCYRNKFLIDNQKANKLLKQAMGLMKSIKNE